MLKCDGFLNLANEGRRAERVGEGGETFATGKK